MNTLRDWAWAQNISPTCKLVLLSLEDRACKDHECWPSVKRLVVDTGLDRKTVLSCLKELLYSNIGLDLYIFRNWGEYGKQRKR